MKLPVIVLTANVVCSVFSCKGQAATDWEIIHINKTAKDSFYVAAQHIDTSHGKRPTIVTGFSAVIFPTLMGEITEPLNQEQNNAFGMPCQCALIKDTLTVVSGIGYEGSFAYVAQVYKNKSHTFYTQYRKRAKWEYNGKKFTEEVIISSVENNLTISKKIPLKYDDLIFGWFEVNTPVFYKVEGEEKIKQQHKTKIYFSCNIEPDIY